MMMQTTEEKATETKSIARSALSGIFWSLATNWGARLATFLLFVVLARFLTPEQYGVVAAANIVLMFIALVAEFGLGDAIVQRRNLQPEEVNLPFYVAVTMSIALALAAALLADRIESWLAVPGLAPVVVWLCGIAPLSTISLFQETIYRRNLAFRGLAYRALVGNLAAGPVAIAAAYLGAGIWSLVILNYLTIGAGMVWMWALPQWWPSRRLDVVSFRALIRFGLSVVTMRVVDFFTLRLIDLIILNRFGVATLGIYTVGSRLYQILMQLLQSALNNVSLSILSPISDDIERIRNIYIRSISLSGFLGAPIFVFSAAASEEICAILFGQKWQGVADISRPLLILGALQCVQYLNGPYLSARGRPHLVLYISLVKYALTIAGLLLLPEMSAANVVVAYSVFQLAATPLTFAAVGLELKLDLKHLARMLAVIAICNSAGYLGVDMARLFLQGKFLNTESPHSLAASIELVFIFGLSFVVPFMLSVLAVGRRELAHILNFANNVARRGTAS